MKETCDAYEWSVKLMIRWKRVWARKTTSARQFHNDSNLLGAASYLWCFWKILICNHESSIHCSILFFLYIRITVKGGIYMKPKIWTLNLKPLGFINCNLLSKYFIPSIKCQLNWLSTKLRILWESCSNISSYVYISLGLKCRSFILASGLWKGYLWLAIQRTVERLF